MSESMGANTTAFRSELSKEGTPVSFETGRVIFKQGGLGNSFFFIVDGQVELQFDGRTRRILKSGDFFGEVRALGNLPRTATATCLTACQLIEVPTEQLDRLMAHTPVVEKKIIAKYCVRLLHAKMRKHMERMPLSESDYVHILSKFERMHLPENKYLFSEGSQSDSLYLILRGRISILQNDEVVATRVAGDFVGEMGILHDTPRTADAYGFGVTELLACTTENAKNLLSRYPPLRSYLAELSMRRLKIRL